MNINQLNCYVSKNCYVSNTSIILNKRLISANNKRYFLFGPALHNFLIVRSYSTLGSLSAGTP